MHAEPPLCTTVSASWLLLESAPERNNLCVCLTQQQSAALACGLCRASGNVGPVVAGAGGLHHGLPAVRCGERIELRMVFLCPGGTPG